MFIYRFVVFVWGWGFCLEVGVRVSWFRLYLFCWVLFFVIGGFEFWFLFWWGFEDKVYMFMGVGDGGVIRKWSKFSRVGDRWFWNLFCFICVIFWMCGFSCVELGRNFGDVDFRFWFWFEIFVKILFDFFLIVLCWVEFWVRVCVLCGGKFGGLLFID